MITTCRSDHHPPIHVLHTLLPAVALVPRAAWALCGNSSARRSEIIRESARESTSDTTSTVEVTLTPVGRGTRVRLHHHGFAEQLTRDRHAAGWAHYLPRLAVAGAGGELGADEWRTASPPAAEA